MKDYITVILSAVVMGVAILASVTSSRAEVIYPWCVQYGGGRHGISATVCSFDSYEQCMATARGSGAFCVENPVYPNPAPKTRRPHRDLH